MVSVLTSSSHGTQLFLLQLEPYLGGFLLLLQQGRAGKACVRLNQKLEKRKCFLCFVVPRAFRVIIMASASF